MITLEAAPAEEAVGTRRHRARAAMLAVIAVVVAVVAAAVLWPGGSPSITRLLVAEAAPGTGNTAMVDLERQLVGHDAVPEPGGSQLPDVAAFHRVGIARITIDNTLLTIEFQPGATASQVDRARAVLQHASAITSIRDLHRRAGTTYGELFATATLAPMVDAATQGADGPPGLIAMVSTPDGTWARAAGMADVGTHAPMTVSLQYRIGSTTKTFTAVVVLQLADEGHFSLDDPVAALLPGVLPYQEPITVRQLLNHTSGLVDAAHFGSLDIDPARDVPLVADPTLRAEAERYLHDMQAGHNVVVPANIQVAVAATRPLAFAPGSRFNYSNTDYLVLTMLVEKVAGRSLAAEYETRITGPLHLADTYLPDATELRGPFTRGYGRAAAGGLTDLTDDVSLGSWGAGGLISTAADLTTFFRALLRGQLVRPPLLGQMTTPVPDSAMGLSMDGYGLGLTRYSTPCGTAWGHGGAIGGYTTDVYASTDGTVIAVVAENAAGTDRITTLRPTLSATLYCGRNGG